MGSLGGPVDPGDQCDPGGPGGPGGQGGPGDQVCQGMWFSWSKQSNYRENLRCHACDGLTHGRTWESSAVSCLSRIRKSAFAVRSNSIKHE